MLAPHRYQPRHYPHQKQDELSHRANFDPLMNLGNRDYFNAKALSLLKHAKSKQQSLAVFFMDLDDFKPVNDQLGHDIGDQVLKIVARRLKMTLRASDIICRFGGDEFVFMSISERDRLDIAGLCQRIINHIREPIEFEDHCVKISCSIGSFIVPDHSQPSPELLEQLIHNADVAMYQAKKRAKAVSLPRLIAAQQNRFRSRSIRKLPHNNQWFTLTQTTPICIAQTVHGWLSGKLATQPPMLRYRT